MYAAIQPVPPAVLALGAPVTSRLAPPGDLPKSTQHARRYILARLVLPCGASSTVEACQRIVPQGGIIVERTTNVGFPADSRISLPGTSLRSAVAQALPPAGRTGI
jgi:hypothetical protein